MKENSNEVTYKTAPWKKALCVLLSVIIAFGTFVTLTVGSSKLQSRLGIKTMLSAYAEEFVDTKGAVAVDEEAMLADNHTINLENSDGSNTVYLFSEPISYTDENGKLRTKDISVEKQTDDKLKEEGYEFTNGQNDYRINFSEKSEKGLKVHFDGCTYSIIPQSDIKVTGNENKAEFLNEEFEVFEYKNIYGSGTTLRFYPQLNGVKEEIVLNSNIGQNVFSYKIKTNNCTAVLNEDGTVSLISKKDNKAVQTFSAPFAYDSEYIDGDYGKHYTDCTYSLKDNGNGEYILTVKVDKAWLESEDTVYPVVIDPTTSQLANYRDAGIYNGSSSAAVCYGKDATCCFGRASEYGYGRVLNQFTMPTDIKQGAKINSAYTWQRETTGRTTTTYVTPYMVKDSWAEGTVTWNTRPMYYTSTGMTKRNINSKSTDDPDNSYWYKFNIATAVKKWADKDYPNYGIIFVSSEEADKAYNWRAFTSKQYSSSAMRPYTVINYTNDATAPTITSVTGNPTAWTKNNVTLKVNGAADNSGGVGMHSTPYSFSTTKGSYNWQAGNTKTFSSNCTVYVYVRDAWNNIRLVSTQTINKIDKTVPTIPTVTGNPTSWTNQNYTLTASSTDSQSGVAAYSFSTTAGTYAWQTGKTKVYTGNGTVYVYSKDNAGNISAVRTITINKVDKTAPSAPTVTASTTGWTNDSVTLTANSADTQSGVTHYSFSTTAGVYSWQTAKTKAFSSNQTVYVYAKDAAGNISAVKSYTINNIDKTAPENATVVGNPIDWTNEDVILSVNNASDALSGLNASAYSFDNGATWQAENNKTFSENAVVNIRVKDAANNILTLSPITIDKIDKAAPVISNVNAENNETQTIVTVTAEDNESGIAEYSFDGGVTWQAENICSFEKNTVNSLEIIVKDNAGNTASESIDVVLPEFYEDGNLIGIYNPNTESTEAIQYKIGEGEWTNYTVPFAAPLYTESTVYARIGESESIISKTVTPDTSNVGAYTESNTDFTLSYKNTSFDFIRSYNSTDENWFFSTDSNIESVNSNIMSAVLPDGTELTFVKTNDTTYNNEITGYTLSVIDNGYVINIEDVNYYYGADGLLSSISNKYDDTITISRTTSEITVADGANRAYTLTLDANGNITAVTDPAGNKIVYTYDENNSLAKVIDQAGVTLGEYSYTNGALTKSMFTTITYNSNGKVSSMTEDSGAYVNYIYDDENKTVTTETSVETTASETYNDAFLTVSSTDDDGNTTEYTYDEYYRTLTETSGGTTVTYTYDNNGSLISEVSDDEEAENSYYIYDSNNNLIRQQTGKDYTYYTYNENGETALTATLKENYTGEIPALYDSSLTCFDTECYTYDSGMLTKTVNSKSNETVSYTYDEYGNAVKVTTLTQNGDSSTVRAVDSTYDVFGNLLTSTNGEETSSYIYDKAGRTLLANENGDCTRTIYDSLGRTVQEISPEDYDSAKDGLPAENTYSDSNAGQTYVYDTNNGTLTSETNRLGQKTAYFYNDIGSKIREEFDIYKFYYLNHGELYQVKVAGVTTVAYSYDNDFNLLSETYANDDVIRYTYNDNGDIAAQYHNSNAKPYVTYTYNEENELAEKINTDTGLKYIYGENGHVSIYKISDNTLVQSYSEEEIKDENANANTDIELGEDGESYLLKEGYPNDGTKITETHFGKNYSSFASDRSLKYTFNENTVEFNYKNKYLPDGKVEDRVAGDSVKYNDTVKLSAMYTYDDNDNILKKTVNANGTALDLVNTYDDKDRITSSAVGGKTTSYTYDENDQLIGAEGENYSASYSYDNRGNITNKTVNGTATAFTYANSGWKDQLVAVNGTELTYDANGNVLTYGSKEYTWNTGRNLASITDGENTYSYTYDENGIRTSKTVNGVTTNYNTQDGVILSQSDGTNTMYFQYDTSGVPFGFIYNDVQYFYITNQMGDVIAITNTDGTVIASYTYDAWGGLLDVTGANTDIANANPIRYRGYYYDAETSYYYLQSRYYDSSICRFINSDIAEIANMSKGIPVGTNLFAYCNNEPVSNSDSDGFLAAKIISKIVLGAIFGLLVQLVADGICIAIKLQKGLSSVGTYVSNIAQSALDTVLKKGIYKAVIITAIGEGITQILNRIIDKKAVDLGKYIHNVIKSAIKYWVKDKINVKINSRVEKKIEQKLPYILQDIAKYAYYKVRDISVKTVSYNAIKKVISKYTNNLWNYSMKKLASALK